MHALAVILSPIAYVALASLIGRFMRVGSGEP